jgi:hypothetical protein
MTTNLNTVINQAPEHPNFDRYDYYRVQKSYGGESWYGFLDSGSDIPESIEEEYGSIIPLDEESEGEILAEFGENAPLVFTSDEY